MSNIIIRPYIAARDRHALCGGALVHIEGIVQHEGGVVNVLATRIAALAQQEQYKP